MVAPKGQQTRPTSDRVRESLFSILFDVEGERILDLFAGTGAVGMEALSRGAAHCHFVEKAPAALAALRKNLGQLSLNAQAQVWSQDVRTALPKLLEKGPFDVIFADPPYALAKAALPPVLEVGATLLSESGWLIFETADREPPLAAPQALTLEKVRSYGEAKLAFYRRAVAPNTA